MNRWTKGCLLGFAAIMFFCLGIVMPSHKAHAAGTAVYVSDNGNDNNSGTSSSSPYKTLTKAFSAVSGDGTVVICGKLTLSSSSGVIFPTHDSGRITLTSHDGTTDYRQTASAALVVKNHLYLSEDCTFENLTFNPVSAIRIHCRGHNVTFGSGLTVTLSGSGSYPYIYGGTYGGLSGTTASNCSYTDYTIRVDSGTWSCVRGGSLRDNGAHPLGTVSNVRVIINGGTFKGTGSTDTDLAVMTATGFCGLRGNASLEINGGEINCSVMAVGRPGSNTTGSLVGTEGNVSVSITGGSFKGKTIQAVQQPSTTTLRGNYTLKVTGGSFSSLLSVSADGVEGNAEAISNVAAVTEKCTETIARTVFVSGTGSDSNTGNDAAHPVKTIPAATAKLSKKGGTLVICGNVTASGSSLCRSDITGRIRLTGKFGTTDFGGKLTVSGTATFPCELVAEDLTLSASGAVLTTAGHDLTVGEGVNVNGTLSLNGGAGETGHRVFVHSGNFATVSGGSAKADGVCVVICGGTAATVYGASGKANTGSASVIVTDGAVSGKIVAAQMGTTGDAGIALWKSGTTAKLYAVESGTVSGTFGVTLCYGTTNLSVTSTGVLGSKLCSLPDGGLRPSGFMNGGRATFAADGGTGSGLTPMYPTGTIGSAVSAAKAASTGNWTVVPLGDVYVNNDTYLVSVGGNLTLGGWFCGVDYRLAYGSRIRMNRLITLADPTEIRSVEFYADSSRAYIAAKGKKTVVAADVTCDKNFGFGVARYPSICGGELRVDTKTMSTDLTINGGTWHFAYGGSIRISSSSGIHSKTGNSHLTVNGGHFVGGVSASGINNLTGNATLDITGGIFDGSVYGSAYLTNAQSDPLTVRGNITINISGGVFHGDILCAQRNEELLLYGDYTLNVTGGDLSRVCTIRGAEGLSTYAAGNCTSTVKAQLDTGFAEPVSGNYTFENPIADYADPSVYYYDGWYYYSYSNTFNGKPALWAARAANFADIGAAEPMLVWSAAASGTGGDIYSLWAPQIYCIDGCWYIYATCNDAETESEHRRPYVWIGKGESIFDGFTYHGVIDNCDENVKSYLSPRLIEYGGKRYLVFGGFFRPEDRVVGTLHLQRLFIVQLATPTKFATGATVISSPDKTWEKSTNNKVQIMEGPFPIYAPDGTLYLSYSAAETSGDEYCTGLLKFTGRPTDSLANASLWQKYSDPMQFVDYSTGVYSPGATVFIPSADGTSLWAIFHAKLYRGIGYAKRVLFAQPVTFVSGVPTLHDPFPVGTPFTTECNARTVASRIEGFDSIQIQGDVDGDGQITNSDIAALVRALSGWDTGKTPDAASYVADLTRDGKCNNRDAIVLIRKITGWDND